MTAIYSLASIGSLICGILVLVQLFKTKGVLHGLLGLLSCMLYPLIWGWINAKTLNISKIMLAWTVCIVIVIFTGGAASKQMLESVQKLQTPAAQPVK